MYVYLVPLDKRGNSDKRETNLAPETSPLSSFHCIYIERGQRVREDSEESTYRFFEPSESVKIALLGEDPDSPTAGQPLPIDDLNVLTLDLFLARAATAPPDEAFVGQLQLARGL